MGLQPPGLPPGKRGAASTRQSSPGQRESKGNPKPSFARCRSPFGWPERASPGLPGGAGLAAGAVPPLFAHRFSWVPSLPPQVSAAHGALPASRPGPVPVLGGPPGQPRRSFPAPPSASRGPLAPSRAERSRAVSAEPRARSPCRDRAARRQLAVGESPGPSERGTRSRAVSRLPG